MRISILTSPVESNSMISSDEIGGHYAVTRSLLKGLQEKNIDYTYNPDISNITSTVVVLSGVDALRSVISLKNAGKVKYIAAGPNISVYATDYDSILSSKEVDLCIVPSTWVSDLYTKDIPALRNRILVWPAGVNQHYWNTSMFRKKRHCLLYVKDKSYDLHSVIELLTSLNINYHILNYGEYTTSEYRRLLRVSSFAIFISGSESQGIALQECWSTDTPTLVWKNTSIYIQGESKGMTVEAISTAPYLTEECGHFWQNIEELKMHIEQIRNSTTIYNPRKWILENMTDRQTATILVNKLILEGVL